MTSAVRDRGQKLMGMEENFDQLEESSASWLDDVKGMVKDSKRKAFLGSFGL